VLDAQVHQVICVSAVIGAVAGQKGGAGKTTVAVNLAGEGIARGLRVLLVDADPQGSARTWVAVGAEGGYQVPVIAGGDATMHTSLPARAKGFDLVVVDTPPRAGEVQRSAIVVANVTIIPCGPSGVDAWALATTGDVLTQARAVKPKLRAAVIITKQRPRTLVGRSAREVCEAAGFQVLRTELTDRVAYIEAMNAGRGVGAYAPRDPAAEEVRAMFDELVILAGGKV
jgi:chromosome partitioning protein